MILDPLKVYLDNENYRIKFFYEPDIEQQDEIRELLVDLEERNIQNLVDKITTNKWLKIGIRPVAFEENDRYIVLEGNCRLTACQMILDETKRSDKIRFPDEISDEVIQSLNEIEFDIVNSREEADPILADRHIDGAQKWTTIAKQSYSVDLFEKGHSIDSISKRSALKTGKIKDALKGYYLIKYGKELIVWDEEELDILKQPKLPVDRVLRLFGKSEVSSAFGLQFDEKYQPSSTKGVEVFDEALEFIFRKAFIETDPKPKLNTRSEWSDFYEDKELIPLIDILDIDYYILTEEDDDIEDESVPPIEGNTAEEDANMPKENQDEEVDLPKSDSNEKGRIGSRYPFMGGLNCNIAIEDYVEPDGILAITSELHNLSISKRNGYEKYPIASGLLLRSLIEQSLKFHLKNTQSVDGTGDTYWQKFTKGKTNFDPALSKIIDYITKLHSVGQKDVFANNLLLARLYEQAFCNSIHKESLDLTAHHSQVYRMHATELERIAEDGVFGFLQELYKMYE